MILRHPRDKSTPPLLSHPTTALSNHRFPTPIPSDTPLLLPIPIPSEEYESLIRFAAPVPISLPPVPPCRYDQPFPNSAVSSKDRGKFRKLRDFRSDQQRSIDASISNGSRTPSQPEEALARLLLSRNPKRAGSAMLSSSLASPRNREGRGREKWNERARNVTTR